MGTIVNGDGLTRGRSSPTPATEIAVAPTPMSVPTVVAPAVPTAAITADSALVPVSTVIVWPTLKSATPATLMLFAPIEVAADRMVAGCIRKSAQLLLVSLPSGKRPVKLSGRRHWKCQSGTTTIQPPLPWSPPAWRVPDWRSCRYRWSCFAASRRPWRRQPPCRSRPLLLRKRAGAGREGIAEPLIRSRWPLVT